MLNQLTEYAATDLLEIATGEITDFERVKNIVEQVAIHLETKEEFFDLGHLCGLAGFNEDVSMFLPGTGGAFAANFDAGVICGLLERDQEDLRPAPRVYTDADDVATMRSYLPHDMPFFGVCIAGLIASAYVAVVLPPF